MENIFYKIGYVIGKLENLENKELKYELQGRLYEVENMLISILKLK